MSSVDAKKAENLHTNTAVTTVPIKCLQSDDSWISEASPTVTPYKSCSDESTSLFTKPCDVGKQLSERALNGVADSKHRGWKRRRNFALTSIQQGLELFNNFGHLPSTSVPENDAVIRANGQEQDCMIYPVSRSLQVGSKREATTMVCDQEICKSRRRVVGRKSSPTDQKRVNVNTFSTSRPTGFRQVKEQLFENGDHGELVFNPKPRVQNDSDTNTMKNNDCTFSCNLHLMLPSVRGPCDSNFQKGGKIKSRRHVVSKKVKNYRDNAWFKRCYNGGHTCPVSKSFRDSWYFLLRKCFGFEEEKFIHLLLRCAHCQKNDENCRRNHPLKLAIGKERHRSSSTGTDSVPKTNRTRVNLHKSKSMESLDNLNGQSVTALANLLAVRYPDIKMRQLNAYSHGLGMMCKCRRGRNFHRSCDQLDPVLAINSKIANHMHRRHCTSVQKYTCINHTARKHQGEKISELPTRKLPKLLQKSNHIELGSELITTQQKTKDLRTMCDENGGHIFSEMCSFSSKITGKLMGHAKAFCSVDLEKLSSTLSDDAGQQNQGYCRSDSLSCFNVTHATKNELRVSAENTTFKGVSRSCRNRGEQNTETNYRNSRYGSLQGEAESRKLQNRKCHQQHGDHESMHTEEFLPKRLDEKDFKASHIQDTMQCGGLDVEKQETDYTPVRVKEVVKKLNAFFAVPSNNAPQAHKTKAIKTDSECISSDRKHQKSSLLSFGGQQKRDTCPFLDTGIACCQFTGTDIRKEPVPLLNIFEGQAAPTLKQQQYNFNGNETSDQSSNDSTHRLKGTGPKPQYRSCLSLLEQPNTSNKQTPLSGSTRTCAKVLHTINTSMFTPRTCMAQGSVFGNGKGKIFLPFLEELENKFRDKREKSNAASCCPLENPGTDLLPNCCSDTDDGKPIAKPLTARLEHTALEVNSRSKKTKGATDNIAIKDLNPRIPQPEFHAAAHSFTSLLHQSRKDLAKKRCKKWDTAESSLTSYNEKENTVFGSVKSKNIRNEGINMNAEENEEECDNDELSIVRNCANTSLNESRLRGIRVLESDSHGHCLGNTLHKNECGISPSLEKGHKARLKVETPEHTLLVMSVENNKLSTMKRQCSVISQNRSLHMLISCRQLLKPSSSVEVIPSDYTTSMYALDESAAISAISPDDIFPKPIQTVCLNLMKLHERKTVQNRISEAPNHSDEVPLSTYMKEVKQYTACPSGALAVSMNAFGEEDTDEHLGPTELNFRSSVATLKQSEQSCEQCVSHRPDPTLQLNDNTSAKQHDIQEKEAPLHSRVQHPIISYNPSVKQSPNSQPTQFCSRDSERAVENSNSLVPSTSRTLVRQRSHTEFVTVDWNAHSLGAPISSAVECCERTLPITVKMTNKKVDGKDSHEKSCSLNQPCSKTEEAVNMNTPTTSLDATHSQSDIFQSLSAVSSNLSLHSVFASMTTLPDTHSVSETTVINSFDGEKPGAPLTVITETVNAHYTQTGHTQTNLTPQRKDAKSADARDPDHKPQLLLKEQNSESTVSGVHTNDVQQPDKLKRNNEINSEMCVSRRMNYKEAETPRRRNPDDTRPAICLSDKGLSMKLSSVPLTGDHGLYDVNKTFENVGHRHSTGPGGSLSNSENTESSACFHTRGRRNTANKTEMASATGLHNRFKKVASCQPLPVSAHNNETKNANDEKALQMNGKTKGGLETSLDMKHANNNQKFPISAYSTKSDTIYKEEKCSTNRILDVISSAIRRIETMSPLEFQSCVGLSGSSDIEGKTLSSSTESFVSARSTEEQPAVDTFLPLSKLSKEEHHQNKYLPNKFPTLINTQKSQSVRKLQQKQPTEAAKLQSFPVCCSEELLSNTSMQAQSLSAQATLKLSDESVQTILKSYHVIGNFIKAVINHNHIKRSDITNQATNSFHPQRHNKTSSSDGIAMEDFLAPCSRIEITREDSPAHTVNYASCFKLASYHNALNAKLDGVCDSNSFPTPAINLKVTDTEITDKKSQSAALFMTNSNQMKEPTKPKLISAITFSFEDELDIEQIERDALRNDAMGPQWDAKGTSPGKWHNKHFSTVCLDTPTNASGLTGQSGDITKSSALLPDNSVHSKHEIIRLDVQQYQSAHSKHEQIRPGKPTDQSAMAVSLHHTNSPQKALPLSSEVDVSTIDGITNKYFHHFGTAEMAQSDNILLNQRQRMFQSSQMHLTMSDHATQGSPTFTHEQAQGVVRKTERNTNYVQSPVISSQQRSSSAQNPVDRSYLTYESSCKANFATKYFEAQMTVPNEEGCSTADEEVAEITSSSVSSFSASRSYNDFLTYTRKKKAPQDTVYHKTAIKSSTPYPFSYGGMLCTDPALFHTPIHESSAPSPRDVRSLQKDEIRSGCPDNGQTSNYVSETHNMLAVTTATGRTDDQVIMSEKKSKACSQQNDDRGSSVLSDVFQDTSSKTVVVHYEEDSKAQITTNHYSAKTTSLPKKKGKKAHELNTHELVNVAIIPNGNSENISEEKQVKKLLLQECEKDAVGFDLSLPKTASESAGYNNCVSSTQKHTLKAGLEWPCPTTCNQMFNSNKSRLLENDFCGVDREEFSGKLTMMCRFLKISINHIKDPDFKRQFYAFARPTQSSSCICEHSTSCEEEYSRLNDPLAASSGSDIVTRNENSFCNKGTKDKGEDDALVQTYSGSFSEVEHGDLFDKNGLSISMQPSAEAEIQDFRNGYNPQQSIQQTCKNNRITHPHETPPVQSTVAHGQKDRKFVSSLVYNDSSNSDSQRYPSEEAWSIYACPHDPPPSGISAYTISEHPQWKTGSYSNPSSATSYCLQECQTNRAVLDDKEHAEVPNRNGKCKKGSVIHALGNSPVQKRQDINLKKSLNESLQCKHVATQKTTGVTLHGISRTQGNKRNANTAKGYALSKVGSQSSWCDPVYIDVRHIPQTANGPNHTIRKFSPSPVKTHDHTVYTFTSIPGKRHDQLTHKSTPPAVTRYDDYISNEFVCGQSLATQHSMKKKEENTNVNGNQDSQTSMQFHNNQRSVNQRNVKCNITLDSRKHKCSQNRHGTSPLDEANALYISMCIVSETTDPFTGHPLLRVTSTDKKSDSYQTQQKHDLKFQVTTANCSTKNVTPSGQTATSWFKETPEVSIYTDLSKNQNAADTSPNSTAIKQTPFDNSHVITYSPNGPLQSPSLPGRQNPADVDPADIPPLQRRNGSDTTVMNPTVTSPISSAHSADSSNCSSASSCSGNEMLSVREKIDLFTKKTKNQTKSERLKTTSHVTSVRGGQVKEICEKYQCMKMMKNHGSNNLFTTLIPSRQMHKFPLECKTFERNYKTLLNVLDTGQQHLLDKSKYEPPCERKTMQTKTPQLKILYPRKAHAKGNDTEDCHARDVGQTLAACKSLTVKQRRPEQAELKNGRKEPVSMNLSVYKREVFLGRSRRSLTQKVPVLPINYKKYKSALKTGSTAGIVCCENMSWKDFQLTVGRSNEPTCNISVQRTTNNKTHDRELTVRSCKGPCKQMWTNHYNKYDEKPQIKSAQALTRKTANKSATLCWKRNEKRANADIQRTESDSTALSSSKTLSQRSHSTLSGSADRSTARQTRTVYDNNKMHNIPRSTNLMNKNKLYIPPFRRKTFVNVDQKQNYERFLNGKQVSSQTFLKSFRPSDVRGSDTQASPKKPLNDIVIETSPSVCSLKTIDSSESSFNSFTSATEDCPVDTTHLSEIHSQQTLQTQNGIKNLNDTTRDDDHKIRCKLSPSQVITQTVQTHHVSPVPTRVLQRSSLSKASHTGAEEVFTQKLFNVPTKCCNKMLLCNKSTNTAISQCKPSSRNAYMCYNTGKYHHAPSGGEFSPRNCYDAKRRKQADRVVSCHNGKGSLVFENTNEIILSKSMLAVREAPPLNLWSRLYNLSRLVSHSGSGDRMGKSIVCDHTPLKQRNATQNMVNIRKRKKNMADIDKSVRDDGKSKLMHVRKSANQKDVKYSKHHSAGDTVLANVSSQTCASESTETEEPSPVFVSALLDTCDRQADNASKKHKAGFQTTNFERLKGFSYTEHAHAGSVQCGSIWPSTGNRQGKVKLKNPVKSLYDSAQLNNYFSKKRQMPSSIENRGMKKGSQSGSACHLPVKLKAKITPQKSSILRGRNLLDKTFTKQIPSGSPNVNENNADSKNEDCIFVQSESQLQCTEKDMDSVCFESNSWNSLQPVGSRLTALFSTDNPEGSPTLSSDSFVSIEAQSDTHQPVMIDEKRRTEQTHSFYFMRATKSNSRDLCSANKPKRSPASLSDSFVSLETKFDAHQEEIIYGKQQAEVPHFQSFTCKSVKTAVTSSSEDSFKTLDETSNQNMTAAKLAKNIDETRDNKPNCISSAEYFLQGSSSQESVRESAALSSSEDGFAFRIIVKGDCKENDRMLQCIQQERLTSTAYVQNSETSTISNVSVSNKRIEKEGNGNNSPAEGADDKDNATHSSNRTTTHLIQKQHGLKHKEKCTVQSSEDNESTKRDLEPEQHVQKQEGKCINIKPDNIKDGFSSGSKTMDFEALIYDQMYEEEKIIKKLENIETEIPTAYKTVDDEMRTRDQHQVCNGGKDSQLNESEPEPKDKKSVSQDRRFTGNDITSSLKIESAHTKESKDGGLMCETHREFCWYTQHVPTTRTETQSSSDVPYILTMRKRSKLHDIDCHYSRTNKTQDANVVFLSPCEHHSYSLININSQNNNETISVHKRQTSAASNILKRCVYINKEASHVGELEESERQAHTQNSRQCHVNVTNLCQDVHKQYQTAKTSSPSPYFEPHTLPGKVYRSKKVYMPSMVTKTERTVKKLSTTANAKNAGEQVEVLRSSFSSSSEKQDFVREDARKRKTKDNCDYRKGHRGKSDRQRKSQQSTHKSFKTETCKRNGSHLCHKNCIHKIVNADSNELQNRTQHTDNLTPNKNSIADCTANRLNSNIECLSPSSLSSLSQVRAREDKRNDGLSFHTPEYCLSQLSLADGSDLRFCKVCHTRNKNQSSSPASKTNIAQIESVRLSSSVSLSRSTCDTAICDIFTQTEPSKVSSESKEKRASMKHSSNSIKLSPNAKQAPNAKYYLPIIDKIARMFPRSNLKKCGPSSFDKPTLNTCPFAVNDLIPSFENKHKDPKRQRECRSCQRISKISRKKTDCNTPDNIDGHEPERFVKMCRKKIVQFTNNFTGENKSLNHAYDHEGRIYQGRRFQRKESMIKETDGNRKVKTTKFKIVAEPSMDKKKPPSFKIEVCQSCDEGSSGDSVIREVKLAEAHSPNPSARLTMTELNSQMDKDGSEPLKHSFPRCALEKPNTEERKIVQNLSTCELSYSTFSDILPSDNKQADILPGKQNRYRKVPSEDGETTEFKILATSPTMKAHGSSPKAYCIEAVIKNTGLSPPKQATINVSHSQQSYNAEEIQCAGASCKTRCPRENDKESSPHHIYVPISQHNCGQKCRSPKPLVREWLKNCRTWHTTTNGADDQQADQTLCSVPSHVCFARKKSLSPTMYASTNFRHGHRRRFLVTDLKSNDSAMDMMSAALAKLKQEPQIRTENRPRREIKNFRLLQKSNSSVVSAISRVSISDKADNQLKTTHMLSHKRNANLKRLSPKEARSSRRLQRVRWTLGTHKRLSRLAQKTLPIIRNAVQVTRRDIVKERNSYQQRHLERAMKTSFQKHLHRDTEKNSRQFADQSQRVNSSLSCQSLSFEMQSSKYRTRPTVNLTENEHSLNLEPSQSASFDHTVRRFPADVEARSFRSVTSPNVHLMKSPASPVIDRLCSSCVQLTSTRHQQQIMKPSNKGKNRYASDGAELFAASCGSTPCYPRRGQSPLKHCSVQSPEFVHGRFTSESTVTISCTRSWSSGASGCGVINSRRRAMKVNESPLFGKNMCPLHSKTKKVKSGPKASMHVAPSLFSQTKEMNHKMPCKVTESNRTDILNVHEEYLNNLQGLARQLASDGFREACQQRRKGDNIAINQGQACQSKSEVWYLLTLKDVSRMVAAVSMTANEQGITRRWRSFCSVFLHPSGQVSLTTLHTKQETTNNCSKPRHSKIVETANFQTNCFTGMPVSSTSYKCHIQPEPCSKSLLLKSKRRKKASALSANSEFVKQPKSFQRADAQKRLHRTMYRASCQPRLWDHSDEQLTDFSSSSLETSSTDSMPVEEIGQPYTTEPSQKVHTTGRKSDASKYESCCDLSTDLNTFAETWHDLGDMYFSESITTAMPQTANNQSHRQYCALHNTDSASKPYQNGPAKGTYTTKMDYLSSFEKERSQKEVLAAFSRGNPGAVAAAVAEAAAAAGAAATAPAATAPAASATGDSIYETSRQNNSRSYCHNHKRSSSRSAQDLCSNYSGCLCDSKMPKTCRSSAQENAQRSLKRCRQQRCRLGNSSTGGHTHIYTHNHRMNKFPQQRNHITQTRSCSLRNINSYDSGDDFLYTPKPKETKFRLSWPGSSLCDSIDTDTSDCKSNVPCAECIYEATNTKSNDSNRHISLVNELRVSKQRPCSRKPNLNANTSRRTRDVDFSAGSMSDNKINSFYVGSQPNYPSSGWSKGKHWCPPSKKTCGFPTAWPPCNGQHVDVTHRACDVVPHTVTSLLALKSIVSKCVHRNMRRVFRHHPEALAAVSFQRLLQINGSFVDGLLCTSRWDADSVNRAFRDIVYQCYLHLHQPDICFTPDDGCL